MVTWLVLELGSLDPDSSALTLRLPRPLVNPLSPKSDQHPNSPYHITPESNLKVMRIVEMITY